MKKGFGSRDFHQKGRSPFIDCSGFLNYSIVTLHLGSSYTTSGAIG
jgi:hypothetical protein